MRATDYREPEEAIIHLEQLDRMAGGCFIAMKFILGGHIYGITNL